MVDAGGTGPVNVTMLSKEMSVATALPTNMAQAVIDNAHGTLLVMVTGDVEPKDPVNATAILLAHPVRHALPVPLVKSATSSVMMISIVMRKGSAGLTGSVSATTATLVRIARFAAPAAWVPVEARIGASGIQHAMGMVDVVCNFWECYLTSRRRRRTKVRFRRPLVNALVRLVVCSVKSALLLRWGIPATKLVHQA